VLKVAVDCVLSALSVLFLSPTGRVEYFDAKVAGLALCVTLPLFSDAFLEVIPPGNCLEFVTTRQDADA
jgi:hypothetical protein